MYAFLLIRWKFNRLPAADLAAFLAAGILTQSQHDAILAAPRLP